MRDEKVNYNKISDPNERGDRADNNPIDEAVPSESKETIMYMVHNCFKLNVRKQSSTNSEVINVIDNGSIVSLESVKDNIWSCVKLENGDIGYVMSEYIKEV